MPQVERDFIGNQKLDGGGNGIIVASSVHNCTVLVFVNLIVASSVHIVLFWFLLT